MFTMAPFLFSKASVGAPTGPDLTNVQAFLRMDGADGSTAFDDATGRIWTPSGGAHVVTSHWAGGAFEPGSSGMLSAANMIAGTVDFCIEFDLNLIASSHGGEAFIGAWGSTVGSNSWIITDSWGPAPDRRLTLAASTNGMYDATVRHLYGEGPSAQLAINEWQRVSIGRIGSVLYLARNGIMLANTPYYTHLTTGDFSIYNPGEPITIRPTTGTPYQIKQLRITVGDGRYNSDYIPPIY